jgi:lysophospholipase L1-like esterase
MAKEYDVLLEQAETIRTEVEDDANSAERVGGMFKDIIEKSKDESGRKLAIKDLATSVGYSTETSLTQDAATRLVSEYNVSINHPTAGVDETNRYTLSEAIAKVPAELRNAGVKVSFLDESGSMETWEFRGESWAIGSFSQVGAGKLTELENNKANIVYTDAALVNKFLVKLYIDKTGYTGSENIEIIRLRTVARNNNGQWVLSLDTINDVVLADLSDGITEETSILSKEQNGIYFYAEVNWSVLENGKIYSLKKEINSYAYIQDPRLVKYLYDKENGKSQSEINRIAIIKSNEFERFSKNNILAAVKTEENEGYYQFNTGEFIPSPSGIYKTVLISINTDEDYFITTALSGSTTAMAVFFDAEKNYLGYQNRSTISGQEYQYINEKLVYPKECKYVGITRQDTYIDRIIINTASDASYVITNVLQGKKIGNAGDSIAEGILTDDIPFYEKSYKPLYGKAKKTHMYYIAKENKCQWYNYGISGSTLGDCFAIGADRNGFSKVNGRYTKMTDDLDYLLLMFGTNDADYGMWMLAEEYVQSINGGTYKMFPAKGHSIGEEGVMTQDEYNQVMEYTGEIDGQSYTGMDYWRRKYIGNINDTTNKTWCGAWNIVLEYIFSKYKHIKILIWLNPTNYVFDESTKAIAEKWGVPYLDMHDVRNPTIWNRNEQENTYINGAKLNSYQNGRNITKRDIYTADGLHPNNNGYKYIYPIINSYLKAI